MKIEYKYIEHERTSDAPFIGALIVAPTCRMKCKNCFNQELKKLPTKMDTVEHIIDEVRSNPFNQGIILAGLEWSENPKSLIALVDEASKHDLQIMIYTGLGMADFHERIGRACADKVGFKMFNIPEFLNEKDPELFRYIGASVLDYYIPSDYYIKTGKYDETKLAEDRVHFGVKLASENQNIYLIKKVLEDENGDESK